MLGLVVAGVIGLGGEAWLLLGDLRRPRPSTTPTDLRPPDGHFERAPIPGAVGIPNSFDPELLRFERFEDEPPRPAAVDRPAAEALLGRVLVVSLFVGRFGRPWSDSEIAATFRALGRAAQWIEREALRWQATVNVDLAATYFAAEDPDSPDVEVQFVPEGDHVGPFEAHADSKTIASASRAALALGFADIEAMMRAVGRRCQTDAVVWLVHLRAGGRSLAIPGRESPVPGVALAVCYAREASFPEPLDGPPFPDPATFAHEALHLFGATDKYREPLRTYPAGLVTRSDIMCLYEDRLSRLRVDRLTAREIGWEAR